MGVMTSPHPDLEQARAQLAFIHSVLPALSGERCYIFGLLMYERLVEVAERVYPTGLPSRGVPYAQVEVVLTALWDRLPDEPGNPFLSMATSGWLSDEPGQGAVETVLAERPAAFNRVRIGWRDTASGAALVMWDLMTSAVPTALYPIEFDAEREALEALRDEGDLLDLVGLRVRAREPGRKLAGLGMA